MKYLRYAWYILRHKYYVYQAGRGLGIGRIHLLKHDLSKFLPLEFFPYAERFYGQKNWKDDKQKEYRIKYEFQQAWRHHWENNPHHWQYWSEDTEERGFRQPLPSPLPMPLLYRKEMLADWTGAGMAQGKPDIAGWYEKNKEKMDLHPSTRQWIERRLEQ